MRMVCIVVVHFFDVVLYLFRRQIVIHKCPAHSYTRQHAYSVRQCNCWITTPLFSCKTIYSPVRTLIIMLHFNVFLYAHLSTTAGTTKEGTLQNPATSKIYIQTKVFLQDMLDHMPSTCPLKYIHFMSSKCFILLVRVTVITN